VDVSDNRTIFGIVILVMNDRIRWSFARPTHRRFGALDPGEKQRLQRVRPCWRTTRHAGYAVSGRLRKRIEEVFGWTKAAAGFRKTRHRGLTRVGRMFPLTATAYNLVRLPSWWEPGRGHARILPRLCATTAKTIKIDAAPVSMTRPLQL